MRRRVRGSVRAGWLVVCASTLAAGLGCENRGAEPLANAESPIIGGKLDTTHKGVVALLRRLPAGQGGGFYPSCTGTLLTQNLVLTARHCVAELTSGDGTVDCGPQNVTKFKPTDAASNFRISIEANVGEEGLAPYQVTQVWVPPSSSDVCGTDIALMMLDGAGIPASQAATIAPRIESVVPTDDVFSAIGYGLQDPNDQLGQTAGHRMAVANATVYCQGPECQTNLVKADEFVAESPVCSGDSGGPALDSVGRVCGVTSRGDADCTVAIYSSVAAWRDFIVEKTFEAAQSGGYAPPTWAGDPPPGFETGGSGGGGAGGASQPGSGGTTSSVQGGSAGAGGGSVTGGRSNGGGGASNGDGGKSSSSAGNQSVGAGPGSVPTFDQLGAECSEQQPCLGSYKCWAASGSPRGICVPTCSAAKTSCPSGYACDTALNACTTANENQGEAHDDGGCSLSGSPAPGPNRWLGAALLVAQTVRRRSAKRRARAASG